MLGPVLLVLTSVGLSADAFAAALARGVAARRVSPVAALRVGAVFGLAEGLMCLAGWSLAALFAGLVEALDHWIALALLTVIGISMIRAGLSGAEEETAAAPPTAPSLRLTVLTAIGTSIDSAAVGGAFAMAGTPVWAAAVVGLASFLLSSLGYLIGPAVGAALGRKAEIAGGLVLIFIGLSIFVSHVTGG